MNLYAIAIERCVTKMKETAYKRPLPATMGAILYDYVKMKKGKIVIPVHVKQGLWSQVSKVPYTKNKSVINAYKSELIRCYLFNKPEVMNKLFDVSLFQYPNPYNPDHYNYFRNGRQFQIVKTAI